LVLLRRHGAGFGFGNDTSVKTQINRIYEKLEVRNRLDLLALAIERGWVDESRARKVSRG
jgi:hypothetical protein